MDMILIGDLPAELVHSVGRNLADYTVGFLRVDDGEAELLGSGVLVVVESTSAILTAHHVLGVLPKEGRIGLFLGQTNAPHTIDTRGVAFLSIGRGDRDSLGPDLGALILAPNIASSIAAKKTFYNLSRRREQMLTAPPPLDDGAWFANGFLAERTTVTHDTATDTATKWFYNFSGVGGPDSSPQVGRHDYFEFPVSHEARAEGPASWGGMSGGGLWQVPLKRDAATLVAQAPLLSGVLFYQHPTTATQCGVRGHGRRSVYDVAYESIRAREP